MPYLMLSDLSGMIPGQFLIEALDDDGDGAADSAVVDQVLADAGAEVDGKVGGRYKTPFTMPYPAKVVLAAKFFAIRALYTRRGKADANPYKKQADDMDTELAAIAKGDAPLDPNISRAKPSVSAITEPVATTPAGKTNA